VFNIPVLQIPSLKELSDKLYSYMGNYNESVRGASMDLVFFKDAMTHLVKVIHLQFQKWPFEFSQLWTSKLIQIVLYFR